jgi:hypothetical protein
MAIVEIRILPPLAVGRLGASAIPLEAFDLKVDPQQPLGFRTIVPCETFELDADTGAIARAHTPARIRFKDHTAAGGAVIRPLAPFLEVFAVTDERPDTLVPLTLELLAREGLGVDALRWSVSVGNIKIFRRTGDCDDKIVASVEDIQDHAAHPLLGECGNFLPDRRLPLGEVRFVRPTPEFPQIRLRFTPAAGKVYGASTRRIPAAGKQEVDDPIINSDELVLYDRHKGGWRGYSETVGPTLTNPAQIYAGYADGDAQVSWGYLDDECDGFVRVTLRLADGRELSASSHIGAGPPAFAPDTLPPRAVSDELEQILLGPEVDGPVSVEQAQDVVRRAFETVRLMNVAVMNGNPVDGRENVASTMVRQDTGDFERLYEPIMAGSLVDTLAVRDLHARVYAGMGGALGPWFADALRRPEEIGDLSSAARRKMPALMRNADGRALCLTRRMIDTVVQAAAQGMFGAREPAPTPTPGPLATRDLVAQLHHRGAGNPFSVLPRAAISNCFPGLEYDFRNLWRRALVGIVVVENNNYVVAAEGDEFADLVDRRLLAVDGRPTMVVTEGPVFPGGGNQRLATAANPNAVSFMEWSNSLAHVLQKQGQEVVCKFTRAQGKAAATEVVLGDLTDADIIERKLVVRTLFERDTVAFADGVLEPGELTQGLCSPWQNDYRECACYYWAASRPDYVNVEPGSDGLSHGDSWMAKRRTGRYIPDNRTDSRLLSYDDLFRDWQGELHFIIAGRDAEESS